MIYNLLLFPISPHARTRTAARSRGLRDPPPATLRVVLWAGPPCFFPSTAAKARFRHFVRIGAAGAGAKNVPAFFVTALGAG